MKRLRWIFLVLFSATTILGKAQVGNLHLHEQLEQLVMDSINADPWFHTAVKPYRLDQIKGYDKTKQGLGLRTDFLFWHNLLNKDQFASEAFGKKLLVRPIFTTELGPLLTGGLNYEPQHEGTVQDVQMGANLYSDITERLTIDLSFAFTNWSAPDYLQGIVDSTEVIPRWGEYKNGDKYSAAGSQFFGELSYAPTQNFHFQLGRGKHFLGDGYRSLLLSDNVPFYNYFRASADIWRFKYIFLMAQHKDLNPYEENEKYSNKYIATHFLSYNVTKWLNLNFFETIVQQARDSVTNIGLDVNYLNPVAFFRPIEFNSGSPDNALLGVGGKLRFSKALQLYGQAIVDEFILAEMKANRGFWGNKYGIQAGFKWRPQNRLKGFFLRGEMNAVRPFTYSHGTSAKVYGSHHYPLAHPLGANFKETLFVARYNRGRLGLTLKHIRAQKGLDQDGSNFGGDIYLNYDTRTVPEEQRIEVENWDGENDFGHQLAQGLKTDIRYTEFKMSFLLNPHLNLAFELGAVFRTSSNTLDENNYTYAFFGLRTYLFNNMLDY